MLTIPGTSTQKQSIRWHRGPDMGHMRTYTADVDDGLLVALVGREPASGRMLWHISISHRDRLDLPDRCPTWDEMKHAKFTLVPDDVAMVLIFPRRSDPYVNTYPTCLHLWESTDQEIGVT